MDISFDDNVITTTLSDASLQLSANGTAIIYIPVNDAQISTNLTAGTLNATNVTVNTSTIF